MEKHNPKIGLIGYGAMGLEIEKLAKELGYIITEKFDINHLLKENINYDFDVAIDFSVAESVLKNAEIIGKLGKNIVLGTTGWYDKDPELRELVTKHNIGLVWGSNFSIGMQVFFNMIANASKFVSNMDYDIMLHEIHHKNKRDSPSGTALSIANVIMENAPRKNTIEINAIQGMIPDNVLQISSTRGGHFAGTHTVYFDSLADTLEITHLAKNRSGFALGALKSAKWLKNKKGYYNFNEIVQDI